MKRLIKTLSAGSCLFAGAFVLLGAADVSATPFKRLGVGYCGSNDAMIVNSGASSTTFQCTIPSDDLLGHADITDAQVYVANSGGSSGARACVVTTTGGGFICGVTESSANATTTLTPDLSTWANYPTLFPYVRVTLGAGSTLVGIKIVG